MFNSRARQKGKVVEKETFKSDERVKLTADLGRVRAILETIEHVCDYNPTDSMAKIEALAVLTAGMVEAIVDRLSSIALIQCRSEKGATV